MRTFSAACILAVAVSMGACSGPRRDAAANAAACSALAKALGDQEKAFVTQVQDIRSQHLVLKEYDRRMIAIITDRRNAIQATELTELSVSDEVAGCSGDKLDELRYRAQQKMASLRDFLNDFTRALKTDPDNVFIDSP